MTSGRPLSVTYSEDDLRSAVNKRAPNESDSSIRTVSKSRPPSETPSRTSATFKDFNSRENGDNQPKAPSHWTSIYSPPQRRPPSHRNYASYRKSPAEPAKREMPNFSEVELDAPLKYSGKYPSVSRTIVNGRSTAERRSAINLGAASRNRATSHQRTRDGVNRHQLPKDDNDCSEEAMIRSLIEGESLSIPSYRESRNSWDAEGKSVAAELWDKEKRREKTQSKIRRRIENEQKQSSQMRYDDDMSNFREMYREKLHRKNGFDKHDSRRRAFSTSRALDFDNHEQSQRRKGSKKYKRYSNTQYFHWDSDDERSLYRQSTASTITSTSSTYSLGDDNFDCELCRWADVYDKKRADRDEGLPKINKYCRIIESYLKRC